MRTYPFELEYYVTEAGKVPFKEWLNGLKDISARARIRIRLDRVRLGNLGDSRSVGEGVCELKVDYGPGYRIYFAHEGKRIILLLMGGDKSTQAKDVDRAKLFLKDWKGRKGDA
jgi:putative addiction module killer protein